MHFVKHHSAILLITLSFTLLRCVALHAQAPDFRFNNIYKEDGLPSNDIKGTVKDKLGFLWIATTNGLCRYDAKGRIKIFQKDIENDRLHSSTIQCIYRDSRDFLWIGARQGGLTKIDVEHDEWITYRHRPKDINSLAHDDVLSITEDDEGRIWFGTENGVSIFYPEEERFVTFRPNKSNPTALQSGAVLSILKDDQGWIWLGTWGGGLHLFLPDKEDIANSTFRNFMIPENEDHRIVWGIHQDGAGRHWLGEEFGLTYMQLPPEATNDASKQSWKQVFHIYKNKKNGEIHIRQGRSFIDDSYGNLWFVSLTGINLIRQETLKDIEPFLRSSANIPKLEIQNFVADENDFFSISNNIVHHIYEDNQQLIWISTAKGLSQFDWRSRQFEFIQPTPENNAMFSTMISGGIVFSIDEEPYIYVYDIEKRTTKRLEPPRRGTSNVGFKRINSNADGTLSLHNSEGIRIYDMSTNTYLHEFFFEDYSEYFNINQAVEIRFIFHDHRLWMRGINGLAVFDTRYDEFKNYGDKGDSKHSLASNAISDFQLDSEGNLWISGWGGISILSKAQLDLPRLPDKFKFTTHKAEQYEEGFISDKIATIQHTHQRMYMGTQKGLMSYEYDTQKFVDRTNQDNVYAIYSIYEWKEDDIWMSIEGGIVNYDAQKELYKVYHSKYGLNNIQLRDGTSYTDGKGGMYFTGANIIVKVKPDEFKENETPPIISITDAQILNKDGEKSVSLINAEQLDLRHGDYRLALSFSALNYDAPERNQYAYQLKGFDEDWIYTQSTEPVVYTNLKAGNYTLKVRAANNDGVWNNEGISLKIIKKPAFWETNIFITAMILLTTLAVFLGVRAYNRTLRKRYKEITFYNVKLNREISERKKVENNLKEKNDELIGINQNLEQFAYICSHDLKEPIRGVHSFINLIEREIKTENKLREKTASFFGYTYNYLKTLQNIIASLGIFTRLNKDEHFTMNAVSIDDIFEKVELNLSELIREKNVVLHFTNSTDSETMHTSEYGLLLILQNLVQNGIKYNTSNTPEVCVNLTKQEDNWLFSVSDNGIGIDQAYHQYIFEPFKTLKNKNTTNSSGLGLAICSKIIAQLGGKIWLKSVPNEGSNFYILLEKHALI